MSGSCERLILALDLPSCSEALTLARRLTPPLKRVKVGPALLAAAGADLVRSLQDLGLGVFLDLKLHDIPSVAAAAARAVGRLKVELLTVHLSGGEAMARAALEGARDSGSTRILGVTLLSSLDARDCRAVGYAGTPEETVARLAGIAAACDLDGVVASAREAFRVRGLLPRPKLLVTPGIRPRRAPEDEDARSATPDDDQARTATPSEALAAGADLLVVGRPITAAPDPAAALAELAREVER